MRLHVTSEGSDRMKPVLLPCNQFDHFYRGGDRIAALRGIEPETDHQPEEWLGATVSRFGTPDTGLAVTADKRMALLPDVPSTGELGYKGLEADTFQGVFAPASAPKPIIARLHGDIMKAMATADMRERLNTIAMIPVGNSPAEFTEQVRTDIARWGKVIREGGIKAD